MSMAGTYGSIATYAKLLLVESKNLCSDKKKTVSFEVFKPIRIVGNQTVKSPSSTFQQSI